MPKPPHPKKRKIARTLTLAAALLLLLAITALCLLPSWISQPQGRAYLLDRLNRHLHATLTVEDWSWHWFDGCELKNVTLTEPNGHIALHCTALHSDLTLWSALWGDYDGGTTLIDGLQLRLEKYTDGSTSLSPLMHNPDGSENRYQRLLRHLRGSFTAKDATLDCLSEDAGEEVHYPHADLNIEIAAANGPVHAQFTAASARQGLTVNATLPPFHEWSQNHLTQLVAHADFEISATALPTGLACDWLQLDPRWENSAGKTLSIDTLSNHPSATMQAGLLSISLRGENPDASLDANALLTPTGTLLLPSTNSPTDGPPYQAEAALHWSIPLGQLLARVNPLFTDLADAHGPIHITLTNLNVPPFPENPPHAQGTAKILFPPLLFHPTGLLAQLLQQTPFPPTAATDLPATAEPLHIQLLRDHFLCEPFTLTLPHHQKITFTGNVSLDQFVNLLATLPTDGTQSPGTLGSATLEFPIRGTVTHPTLTLPH